MPPGPTTIDRASPAPLSSPVALARRGSSLLVEETDRLREAVASVRAERPFRVEAWVALPDHMHAVWTLPEGDADHSQRGRLIKTRVSRGLTDGPLPPSHRARHQLGIWQCRFWEHLIRKERDLAEHLRFCWTNPVKPRAGQPARGSALALDPP